MPVPVLPLLTLLVMSIALWWPAIAGTQTLISGDSIVHGLPLFNLLVEFFQGRASLLWTSDIYGGHPIFAEGQGAFAEPLNMLFAGLVAPWTGVVRAENLFHCTSCLLTGVGMLGFCLELGISAWSGCFAALAVMFAPFEVRAQTNLTISGSLTWVPYALWTAQRWRSRPDFSNAVLLGLSFAALVLAGYPQTTYATALYAGILLATGLASWRDDPRHRLQTLTLAAAVGLGLGAVQILPLLELVTLSVRSSGIGIFHMQELPHFKEGLFSRMALPICGSLLVSLLIVAGAIGPRRSFLAGHLAAGIFLWVFGCGRVTPLFSLIYDQHLIPGLHAFRATDTYLKVGAIGLTSLAGAGLDVLSAWMWRRDRRWAMPLILASSGCVWITIRMSYALSGILQLELVCLAAAAPGAVLLARRPHLLPMAFVATFCVECIAVRFPLLVFHDRNLLEQPKSIVARKAKPHWRDYGSLDDTIAQTYGFFDPDDPRLVGAFLAMREAESGMTGLLDGVKSLDGALALTLSRRTLLQPVLEADMSCVSAGRAGRRLIDILGVRNFASYDRPQCPGFAATAMSVNGIWTIENTEARPPAQLYGLAQSASGPASALAHLQSAPRPILEIEDRKHELRIVNPTSNASPGAVLRLARNDATVQQVQVSAPAPIWLFVTGADYPGWRAWLDGRIVPVYPAQVLGRAVRIPAGKHDIIFRFVSRSFQLGLTITVITIIGLIAFWIRNRRAPRHDHAAGVAQIDRTTSQSATSTRQAGTKSECCSPTPSDSTSLIVKPVARMRNRFFTLMSYRYRCFHLGKPLG